MKTLFTLALCVSLATAATAQDSTHTHQGRGDHRMTDLHLSNSQHEQLKAINKDFFTAAHALRTDSSLSKADRKTKFDALEADHQNKVKAVLSADQYAQWQQDMSKHKPGMHPGGPGGPGGPDGTGGPGGPGDHRHDFGQMQEKMKEELGLTDTQSQQLATANKDFFKHMGELHKNSASSDSATRRTQFQTLRTNYESTVKGILNADQYAKWQQHEQEMRSHMRPGGPGAPGFDSPRPDFGKMNERIKQDLGLNDDQSKQLSAATQDFFKNAQSLRGTGDSAARRTQFQALKTQYDSKVQAILTPEQFAKWQQHQQEMRRGMGHHHPIDDDKQ
ncbi:hypothetical protein GA0116948_101519 [Chitinophaga costaii]|uniref:LTXXQ motif family protein n=1 Tax=Chitinophaga costaii TaxID=1335309 RepID=A0A1C3ZRP4_9BACT|nr:hypothetical protein [Chitinophaga costaii]SCB84946.1 hypothetical protein GA0116948_101519 [Chitinophaga costaii]